MAGVEVPENTKILIGEVESVDISEEFAHENCSGYLQCIKQRHLMRHLQRQNSW